MKKIISIASIVVFLLALPGIASADSIIDDDQLNPSQDLIAPIDVPASEFSPSIVNGTAADSSRGMAAVLVNGGFRCSGSIVHDRWILTAKHCVYSNGSRISDSQLSVRVKSLQWGSGGGVITISDSKVRTDHDIAMLKLSRSANAEPVSLATAHSPVNATTYVFGWGRTCTSCSVSSVLKRATQNVVTNNSIDLEGGRGIRTARNNGSVCYGDSGGPLFKLVNGNRYQVGVTSAVSSASPCTGTAYFASVPTSHTWIQNVIRNH